jgi:Hemerythrin HHE cation binding domain
MSKVGRNRAIENALLRKEVGMKVTVFLRTDHEVLRGLFDKYKKPSGRNLGKKELFNEIRREILIHSQIELEVFYPALAGTSSTRAMDLVSAAEEEHRAVETLLQELGNMNGSEKTFEPKMDQLIRQCLQHMEREEDSMFDEARKNLPEYRLEELGLEMEDQRKILTTVAA